MLQWFLRFSHCARYLLRPKFCVEFGMPNSYYRKFNKMYHIAGAELERLELLTGSYVRHQQ